MSTLPHLLLLLLTIAMPVWDYFETRHLKRSKNPQAKVGSYQRVIAVLWGLTVLACLATPFSSLTQPPEPERIGSWLPSAGWAWGLGLVVLAVLGTPFLQARGNAELRQTIRQQMDKTSFFLPVTLRERRWWIAVSLSAAICEEIVYRSFLIRYLDDLSLGGGSLGLPWSIVLAAGIFSLAHGYQGVVGILSTAGAGLLFAFLFFATGSLWLPILLHALLDLRLLLVPMEEPASHPA